MRNIIALLFLSVLIVSCGPQVIKLHSKHYEPTDSIELLTSFPADKKYEEVAILMITDEDYLSVKGMMKDLKKEAMRLGANALVLDAGQGQSGMAGAIIPVGNMGIFAGGGASTVTVKGTAIRYK